MLVVKCDICDGKLVMGTGGIAVCSFCGMEYTKERMKEKIQENKKNIKEVKENNFNEIENYFIMAESAYEAGNKEEAEMYCNKIIELDVARYSVWFIKGKAAGWQSTIANIRFTEAVNCFSKALEFVPDDKREKLKIDIESEMRELGIALIALRGERFIKFPDQEEVIGVIGDITKIFESMVNLKEKTGILIYKMVDEIAIKINEIVVETWSSKILPDYNGIENRPNEYEWRDFIARIDCCTLILEKIIELREESDGADIIRYENLIFFEEQAIGSCSWDYEFTDWGKNWRKEYTLSYEAQKLRLDRINNFRNKIIYLKEKEAEIERVKKDEENRIAKEIADKRYNEYWKENSEEKIKLESQKDEILINICNFQNEIKNILDTSEKDNVQNKINKLVSEKKCIGIFKIKEKKLIQNQINVLQIEMNNINLEIEKKINPIKTKIDNLKKEEKEIENELTKER